MDIQKLVGGVIAQSKEFAVHAVTFEMPDARLVEMSAQQLRQYKAAVERLRSQLPRIGLSIEIHRDVVRCCEVFRIARAE